MLAGVTSENIEHLKEITETIIGLCDIKITALPESNSVMIENYTDNGLFHLGFFAAAKAFRKL